MEVVDIKSSSYDDLEERCFHLTRKKNENSISIDGLQAQIGVNSKGVLGREKTNKVFFSKGIKGTLEYINRTLNIAKKIINTKGYHKYIPEEYKKYFPNDLSSMSSQAVLEYFSLKYFNDSLYLLLNLKEGQDYLKSDLNEEKEVIKEQNNINMHVISGLNISPEKISKIYVGSSSNVIDIIEILSEKYKQRNDNEILPTNLDDEELIEKLINIRSKEEKLK